VAGVRKHVTSFWKEVPKFVTKCDRGGRESQFYPKIAWCHIWMSPYALHMSCAYKSHNSLIPFNCILPRSEWSPCVETREFITCFIWTSDSLDDSWRRRHMRASAAHTPVGNNQLNSDRFLSAANLRIGHAASIRCLDALLMQHYTSVMLAAIVMQTQSVWRTSVELLCCKKAVQTISTFWL